MSHSKSDAQPRGPLAALLAGLLIAFGATDARADGSRDLFPAGYIGSRANLDLQPAQAYVGVVRRRTFVYVYAQAGEYILLGSSNRIDGNTAGNIRVYNPQSFGPRGDETIPAASSFDCVAGATGGAAGPHFSGDPAGAGNITGAIATRAAELAGPRSADNSAGAAGTWAPCAYRAPTTGLYGVLFAVSDGGTGPNGAIDPPARSNSTVAAWEVAVRADATATADLRGRAFTYALAFFTGGNGRPVNSDIFYTSVDGFRYRQELRNFDPNGYVLYANPSGFLDSGQPLYKSVRGNNAEVIPFIPAGTGVVAQLAQYPGFFVDIDPAGANNTEVQRVLTALGIPTVPPTATLDSATFSGATGNGSTVVNLGGTFTLSTTNTITFQVVISRNGVDFDPANPANRVLTGLAPGGTINIAWDGRDNAGTQFPVGNFPYQVVGRNGEVHFPMVDVEGNTGGGPTITRLNGPGTAAQRRTVYFDDRGYRTSNGTLVGVLNGSLCPTGTGGTPPAPAFSLVGVDSTTNYRAWPANGNSNLDCVAQPTTQGFGDAKGLELWTHVSTAAITETITITGAQADLSVSKTDGLATVVAGGAITYSIVVSNLGPSAANNATLTDPAVANFTAATVTCGTPTGGATCPAPAATTVALLQGAGIVIPTLPSSGSVTFSVSGTAGASGTILNTANVAPPPGTVDLNTANDSASDTTVIQTPELALAKSNGTTTLLPGASTTYALTVSNIGLAATTAPIGVTDVLPTGITIAAGAVPLTGANAANWTCNAAGQVITCSSSTAIAASASSVFAFTANVAANASGTLLNRARVGGGGDPLNPNSPNEGDTTPCTGNGTPRGCAIDSDMVPPAQLASVKSVDAGADGIASPGEVLTYSIVVSNSGGTNTAPVLVTDPIPANTAYVGGSATGPGASFASNTVSWSIPAGASFPVTLSFQVTVANPIPPGVTSISNTHTLDGQPGCGAPPCTSTPTQSTITSLKSVNAGADGIASPGEVLTYSIVVSNSGGATTAPVVVTDPIPANTTYVGGSATGPGASFAGNTVTWTIPTGATFPVTLSFQVMVANPIPPGVTSITNTHALDGQPGCGAPPCTTTPTQSAVTSLKSVDAGTDGIASPGEVLTYSIVVSNTGGATSRPVVVTDPIPANTTYVGGSATGPGASFAGNTVSWSIPAGATFPVTLTFQVTVANPIPSGVTSITNTHTLDGQPGCGAPPCTTTPTQSTIASLKSVDAGADGFASPGEVLTYSIIVSNTGGATTAPVVVTDPIPANTTYVGGSATGPGASFAGNTVSWSIPAGATFPVTLTFQVTVANPIPAGVTSITNTHTLDGQPGCGTPPCTTTPTQSTITSLKSVNAGADGFASPGEVLTYSIVVSNSGGATSAPVVVTDPIPANTTYVGGSATGPGASFAGNTVSWSIPAGATFPVTLTFQVTVAKPIPPGVTSITNTHTLDSQPGCGTPPCTSTPTQSTITSLKSVDAGADGFASPGEVLTYSIVVSNTGGATSAPVVVSDPIPANTTYVGGSATGPGAAFAGNSVTWTIPTGATFPVTLTFQVTVANPIPAGVTSITNTHTLDGQPGCGAPPCTSTPTQSTITSLKSVNAGADGFASPGEVLTYSIVVSNSGGATSAPVVVTDPIPANTTYVGGSATGPGASFAGNTVSWSIPAGATFPVTLTFQVTVANPIPAGVTSITNTHTLNGQPGCGTPPCTSTPTQSTITSLKSVDAGADGFASPGEVLTYSIVVSNTGGATSAPVVVSDPIPANTTYVGGSATGPGAAFAGNSVTWTIPTGATFPVTLTFQVTVANPIPAGVTSITNTHTLDGQPGCGAPPCTTTPTQSTITSLKSVNAGADGFASPGEVLTYSIIVSNSGGATSAPVVVTDPIPANTTYVGGSATGPGASFAGNTVSWSIPAGATFPVTLSFQVTVANPIPAGVTSITNTHTLDGQPGCGAPPCTTTPTQSTITSLKSVDAGPDGFAAPGEVLTYSIVVSNSGGATSAPVVVTDPIPANTTYVGGSATGPGASFAGNTVSWSIPAGATFPVTLSFQVTVANPIPAGVTSITNTHTLNGQPGCGTPPCTTTPTPSLLTLAKSVADASGNGFAEPGETLVYTITLANSGGTPAPNVSVTDPLDPNTLFVSASNGGTLAGSTVTWTGLTVPANGSLALTLTVTVANPLAAGVTQIRNAAVITGNPLPDCTVASPPANCTSLPVPRISLTKVASSSTVQAPGSVVYTITVRNVGGAAIANVTLSDPLPTGISQFTWTCTGTGVACPAASGTGAINQTVPSFPIGAQLVYAVTATVAANAPATIVDSVTVTPTTVVTCSPSNQPAPCRSDAPVTTGQAVTAVPFADPRTLALLGLMLFGLGLVAARGAQQRG